MGIVDNFSPVKNFIPLLKKEFGDDLHFIVVKPHPEILKFPKKAEKESNKPFCYVPFKNKVTLVCPKWHLEKEFSDQKEEFEKWKNHRYFQKFVSIKNMIEWLNKEFGEKGRGIIKRVNSE